MRGCILLLVLGVSIQQQTYRMHVSASQSTSLPRAVESRAVRKTWPGLCGTRSVLVPWSSSFTGTAVGRWWGRQGTCHRFHVFWPNSCFEFFAMQLQGPVLLLSWGVLERCSAMHGQVVSLRDNSAAKATCPQILGRKWGFGFWAKGG